MSAEPRAAAGRSSAAEQKLAVFTALAMERATLRALPGMAVLQCGPGAERAAGAARAALASGATALLSWGFAGGLAADLAPGSVCVPRCVVTSAGATLACDAQWQAALAAALRGKFAVDERPLFGCARVLTTTADKARSASATGAAAVDMESAAIASVAASAGARFAAVRVIVDGLEDALPANAERFIDERGNRRVAAALGAAFAPRGWPLLWKLGARSRAARAVLIAAAERVGSAGFLVPTSGLR